MNKALVVLGLVAVAMVVATPMAAAHTVVAFPDPETGDCKSVSAPTSFHASVYVFPCRTTHGQG